MGKLSCNDKLRMQTLREQGLGAKAIVSSYPNNGWNMDVCIIASYRRPWVEVEHC